MAQIAFRIMTAEDAELLRSKTSGREHQLHPRLIEAGPHQGSYALSDRVMDDPAFADLRELIWLAASEVTVMDTDEAWPPVEPEE